MATLLIWPWRGGLCWPMPVPVIRTASGPITLPKILELPDTVWINKPTTDLNTTQEASTDAA